MRHFLKFFFFRFERFLIQNDLWYPTKKYLSNGTLRLVFGSIVTFFFTKKGFFFPRGWKILKSVAYLELKQLSGYYLMAYRYLEQHLVSQNPSNDFQDDRTLFEPANKHQ